MKTIRARLTIFYAVSATVTLACLFAVGYQLLSDKLIHGLDLLNAAEFAQLEARIGNGYEALTSDELNKRIRQTSEYASVLFYINIQSRQTRGLFYSSNLHHQIIPDVPGKRNYITSVPGVGELRVSEFETKPFALVIGTPMRQVRELMDSYIEVCGALLLIMLIASVAIGFGLSNLMLRPIRLIRDTANRIRSDNLSERIPVNNVKDEISGLAILLNQMFDRLEIAFDEVRRFTAEASHELKTPLSLIKLHAEKLLVDGGLPPEKEEAITVQLEELNNLNRVIDGLLFLSRAEAHAVTLTTAPQDPAKFLEGFSADAVALSEHKKMRFISSHTGPGRICFDERWIRQVLLNLLSNALKASPPGGLITFKSRLGDGIWRVSMQDEGRGVPTEFRERIFERFVRLHDCESEEKGSGLGLAICRSIIELHKGCIFAEEGEDGVGLRVIFEIPA